VSGNTARQYDVNPASHPPPLSGRIEGTVWGDGDLLSIDNYPWYQSGLKQATQARILYDAQSLYVQFQCEDVHSYSEATKLNGPVYKDSCVELFAAPSPDPQAEYFNFETNCCGTFHLGYGPARADRRLISPELASRITVASSVPTATKEESPDDDRWWLTANLPFDVLSEFTGRRVRASSGDIWRANFYRCGGKTDDQYACWNPIAAPAPDFHRPEFFGRLVFA